MIELQQNLVFDFELPKFDFGLEGIKSRIKVLGNIRFLRNALTRNTRNYEYFVLENKLDNVESIKEINQTLFQIEEEAENLLEKFSSRRVGLFTRFILREVRKIKEQAVQLSNLLVESMLELSTPNTKTLEAMREGKEGIGETISYEEFMTESEAYAKTF